MPFLTKGKTNWKYILILLILAIIIGGGILSFGYMQKYFLPRRIIKESLGILKNINSYVQKGGYRSSFEVGNSIIMVNILQKESYAKTEVNGKTVQEYYDINGAFYYKEDGEWRRTKSTTDYLTLKNAPAKFLEMMGNCMKKPSAIKEKDYWIISSNLDLEKCKNKLEIHLPEGLSIENITVNAKIWIGKKDKFFKKYKGEIYYKDTEKKIGEQWLEFSEYNQPVKIPPLPEEKKLLSSANVYFSKEIQGEVLLYLDEARIKIIKVPYCGAPIAGSKEYTGKAKLIFKDLSLDLGKMTFCENSLHDGRLWLKKLNLNDERDFIIILQYGSCNFEEARFFGYSFKERRLIQYKFMKKDGNIQNEIFVNPKEDFLEILPSREFISEYYDNSIGRNRATRWKFNNQKDIFEEVDSWLNPP